jgi:hypothetical protein
MVIITVSEVLCKKTNQESSVNRATGWTTEESRRMKNFHFSTASRRALGSIQPPIHWVPGVNRPGREADHSSPTSTEVKKTYFYTTTPPYVFMA